MCLDQAKHSELSGLKHLHLFHLFDVRACDERLVFPCDHRDINRTVAFEVAYGTCKFLESFFLVPPRPR